MYLINLMKIICTENMESGFIIFSKIGPEVQAMHLNANIITNFICTVYIFKGKFLRTILSRIYSNL